MKVSLVEASARGLARYGSTYLLSAFLVLAGGYLSLYQSSGLLRSYDLVEVYGSILAYQMVLLALLAYLWRALGKMRDTLVLLAVLGVFLVDTLLMQQLYGWAPGIGRTVALVGGGSAVVLLAGAALALGLPMHGRLWVTAAATILAARFGPMLLVAAPEPDQMAPRYVALGWLYAACLLPAIFLPATASTPSRLPLRTVELCGLSAALTLALVHIIVAGQSFDLPFLLAYVAPFLVLLTPAVERLAPELDQSPAARRLVSTLPYLGLALAASRFPPGLLAAAWAQSWPLTPFCLALVLAAAVQFARSLRDHDLVLRHVAAALTAMALLGGDFPEILSCSRYPQPWQALAVTAVAWSTIVWSRWFQAGLVLQGAAAFVVASWLDGRGYPWVAAYLVLLAAGTLALAPLTGFTLRPHQRLVLVVTTASLPVAVYLADHDNSTRLAGGLVAAAALVAIGIATRDRLLWRVAAAMGLGGVLGLPVAVQRYGEVAPGKLLIQLGFLVLLAGFLNTLYGERLRRGLRSLLVEPSRRSE